ncbi:MAG TPA: hybrid sensor histidine kinase/response regulator [Burkholderiaceae bacterium]
MTLLQSEAGRLKDLFETDQPGATRQLTELKKRLTADTAQDDRRAVLEALVYMSINSGQNEAAQKFNGELAESGIRYHDEFASALAANYQARMLQAEGKFAEAKIEVERALQIANRLNDRKLTYRVNLMAANINGNIGDFKAALNYQLAAMSTLDGDDTETRSERVTAMYMIGNLYLDLKNPQLALEYNAKARALAVSLNEPRTVAALALSRGAAYADMKNQSEAGKAYAEGLTLARKVADHRQEAMALQGLAELALDQERYATCSDYAQQAKTLSAGLSIDAMTANAGIILGLCQIGNGATKRGDDEIANGLDFLRKSGAKPDLEAALGVVAAMYTKTGLYRDAVKALQDQRDLTSELFQADRDREAAELQANFDASERQKQITILEQKNLLQNEEIKVKNLQRALGALTIFVVVALAFTLVRNKEKLRRQAMRQNLDKSKFMADAAHDLRQPLHAIGNLLEAAKHAIARDDTAKSRELIDLTQSATDAMRLSFASVLEVSRLESGLVAADYSSFDLIEMINELCTMLAPLAAERGVQLRVWFRKGRRVVVDSDRHLLGRVLSNLLMNAIKYADQSKGKGQYVIIGAVVLPNRCRIDIVDNGIGIPEAEQGKVFNPFYQIHNPERDRSKGLGLGLSIVRSILHLLMDHRIDMRSTEGIGTRFSIALPRLETPEDVQVQQHASDEAGTEDLSGLYVLLVEDDVLVRKSTEALFREYGILYESVTSLEDLTRRLPALERMPDLVLTDFSLPAHRSAIDVVQVVSAEFEREIPTIVLTGESDNFDAARKAMYADILYKPVNPSTLLNEIRRLCLKE